MGRGIRSYGIIFAFLLFHQSGFSQTDESFRDFPSLKLERTEVRTIYSSAVEQEYELQICLPRDYDPVNKSYPVIYLLDAYRSLLMVKGYLDLFLPPSPLMPEFIVVGIDYVSSRQNKLTAWAIGRTRDLTPVRVPAVEESMGKTLLQGGAQDFLVLTGGADKFLIFLKEELIPFIDSNYPTEKNDRLLAGYSYGGLFCLYALFHAPETFSRYLVGSPSLQYGNGVIFEYEAAFAESHRDLKAKVFMSAGSLEGTLPVSLKKMEELLFSRNYEGLKISVHIFENENHQTCYPSALFRGLMELSKP